MREIILTQVSQQCWVKDLTGMTLSLKDPIPIRQSSKAAGDLTE